MDDQEDTAAIMNGYAMDAGAYPHLRIPACIRGYGEAGILSPCAFNEPRYVAGADRGYRGIAEILQIACDYPVGAAAPCAFSQDRILEAVHSAAKRGHDVFSRHGGYRKGCRERCGFQACFGIALRELPYDAVYVGDGGR